MSNGQEQMETDPNAVVVVKEDGTATYGRLPEGARQDTALINDLNENLPATPSIEKLRKSADEIIKDHGYEEGLVWPLSEEALEVIRSESLPEGILLTKLNL